MKNSQTKYKIHQKFSKKIFDTENLPSRRRSGFTLIELLIVIAIIAILASVVLIALDPLTRFRDSRDAKRWSAARNISDALNMYQVDHGGHKLYGSYTDTSTAGLTTGNEYMISSASTTVGCDTGCSVVGATDDCVNLKELVNGGYLGELPVSPNGSGSWTSAYTGYYLKPNTSGSITIGACEAENTSSISVTR